MDVKPVPRPPTIYNDLPMRNVISFILLVLLLGSAGSLACAQPADESTAKQESDAVRERIIENLKLQLPQLRQAQAITVGPMTSSAVPGFRQAMLTINQRNQVPILIRDDGEQALLLAAPPVDVSRSVAEVQQQLEAENEERRTTLTEAAADMPVRGADDAPVTMVAFSDFQCPYCARSISLIDQVLDRYENQVKFVFLHYPLPNHGWAKPAAVAAQCAARQDEEAFWTVHDAYFANQGQITEDNVIEQTAGYLQETGIDMGAWRTCATDTASDTHQEASQVVDTSLQTGQQLGVRGTPTFFIDGEMMQGPRSVESFGARIEEAAAAK